MLLDIERVGNTLLDEAVQDHIGLHEVVWECSRAAVTSEAERIATAEAAGDGRAVTSRRPPVLLGRMATVDVLPLPESEWAAVAVCRRRLALSDRTSRLHRLSGIGETRRRAMAPTRPVAKTPVPKSGFSRKSTRVKWR